MLFRSVVSLATAVSLAALITVAGVSGPAGATQQPTPKQAQKILAKLNREAKKLGRQYAEVVQQLVLANQRLKFLKKQTAVYRADFDAMRKQVAKLAAVAYEQGGVDLPFVLLTSASPQHILDQASILDHLAGGDIAQIRQYLGATRALVNAERTTNHAKAGTLRLKHALGKRLTVQIGRASCRERV